MTRSTRKLKQMRSAGISLNKAKEKIEERSYAGAAAGRLNHDWLADDTSQDTELACDLKILRNRSRQMVRDNPHAFNLRRIIQNNVVGSGITFQARIIKPDGSPDNELNEAIEAAWNEWCEKDSCHAAGRLSLTDLLRLAIGNVFQDGEFLVRKIPRAFGKSAIPFGLEVIEPDLLLDDSKSILRTDNGRTVRMGVEVDRWMRPQAYWLREHHPGDYQFSTGDRVRDLHRVPAHEIEHLYLVDRWPQTRGTPWMHNILKRLRQMGAYTESELVAARVSSDIVGFIQQDMDTEEPRNARRDDRNLYLKSEPGTFRILRPGETATAASLQRNNENFDPFMRYMLREVAAGIGVSYEALSRDYSQSNYSSSRLALLDERDLWRVLQKWLINNFLINIFREWLDAAVISGQIRIPDYFANKRRYQAAEFKPRGWSWVDPQKEIKAYQLAVRLGIMSRTDAAAAGGSPKDYEEICRDISKEDQLLKDYGLERLVDVGSLDEKDTGDPEKENKDNADE